MPREHGLRALTIRDLEAFGYATAEAEELARHLPQVSEAAVTSTLRLLGEHGDRKAMTLPLARYCSYELAKDLAANSRGVLALMALLEAVSEPVSPPLWLTAIVEAALEWARDDRFTDADLVAYLRAGIGREEVDKLDPSDPERRLSDEMLEFLAAMRS